MEDILNRWEQDYFLKKRVTLHITKAVRIKMQIRKKQTDAHVLNFRLC